MMKKIKGRLFVTDLDSTETNSTSFSDSKSGRSRMMMMKSTRSRMLGTSYLRSGAAGDATSITTRYNGDSNPAANSDDNSANREDVRLPNGDGNRLLRSLYRDSNATESEDVAIITTNDERRQPTESRGNKSEPNGMKKKKREVESDTSHTSRTPPSPTTTTLARKPRMRMKSSTRQAMSKKAKGKQGSSSSGKGKGGSLGKGKGSKGFDQVCFFD